MPAGRDKYNWTPCAMGCGYKPGGSREAKCIECKGTGKIQFDCAACNSTGWEYAWLQMRPSEPRKVCQICKGRPNYERDCETKMMVCGGCFDAGRLEGVF